MGKRYSTRARYCDDLGVNTVDVAHALTVFEPDPTSRFTGILDKGGNKIFVSDTMERIGFVRKED